MFPEHYCSQAIQQNSRGFHKDWRNKELNTKLVAMRTGQLFHLGRDHK